MDELEIPDDAVYAGEEIISEAYVAVVRPDAEVVADDVIRAAAPLIVAAELERIADELDVRREEIRAEDDRTVRSSGLGEGIRHLRKRADELKSKGGKS
jgi:hypothetical protein